MIVGLCYFLTKGNPHTAVAQGIGAGFFFTERTAVDTRVAAAARDLRCGPHDHVSSRSAA